LDALDELVDFSRGQDERITPLSLPQNASDLQNIYRGPIYGLKGFPGVLYAPQALMESLQFDLAYNSVSIFCESPHTTNIDQCPPKKNEELNSDGKMWELWKEDNRRRESSTKKQKVDHSARKKYRSFKKLSWATMGYHYDWTERSYNEAYKSDMPSLVGDLSTIFARTSTLLEPTTKSLSFTSLTLIVNYYNTKLLMGSHHNDLKSAIDKPIVSPWTNHCIIEYRLSAAVSIPDFDNHCCPTIDQKVSSETLLLQASNVPKDDQQALEDYLSSHHRININVRQVDPDPLSI
jgi:hypothetical protein